MTKLKGFNPITENFWFYYLGSPDKSKLALGKEYHWGLYEIYYFNHIDDIVVVPVSLFNLIKHPYMVLRDVWNFQLT